MTSSLQVIPHGVGLLMVLWLVARHDRWRFTLGTLYVAWWSVMILMFLLSPLPYVDVDVWSWVAVYGSMAMVVTGYLVGRENLTGLRDGDVRGAIALQKPSTVNPRVWKPLTRWLGILSVLGFGLFGVYLENVHDLVGLEGLLTERTGIRLNVRSGTPPLGFHFFYFLEFVPALCVLLFTTSKNWARTGTRLGIVALGAASMVSLTTTGARVNIGKAVLLAFIVWIAIRYGVPRWRSVLAWFAPVAAVLLIILLVLGAFRGKTFEGSPVETVALTRTEGLGPVLLVHSRIAAPVATLDRLLQDRGVERTWGGLTLHPVAQVVDVVTATYDAPSHIGEFYRIPYRHNVATQLDVMYKDFGWLGIFALSLLFGLVLGVVQRRYEERPGSYARLLVWSLMVLVVWASTTAAAFIKLSYWLHFGLSYVVGRELDIHTGSGEARGVPDVRNVHR